MNFNNRKFMIFNSSEIDKVDFTQILETSIETLRFSVDRSKTFVKWEGETIPTFMNLISLKEGPYSYEEILVILSSSEWTPEII